VDHPEEHPQKPHLQVLPWVLLTQLLTVPIMLSASTDQELQSPREEPANGGKLPSVAISLLRKSESRTDMTAVETD